MESEHIQFNQKSTFISKVYKTLLLQLMTMTTIIGLTLIPSTELYMQNIVMYSLVPCSFMMIISELLLVSFAESLSDNWITILSATFNVSSSIVISATTLFVSKEVVLLSLFTTFVVLVILNTYASITHHDYSEYHNMMMSVLMALLFNSLMSLYFGIHINSVLSAFTGALLFCTFIVHDTQNLANQELINRRNGHIIAAMSLYLDVLNLFVNILKLLSFIDKKNQRKRHNK